jgi:hypothetical protein
VGDKRVLRAFFPILRLEKYQVGGNLQKKARREDGERSVESIGLKIISNTGVKVKKIVWINRK